MSFVIKINIEKSSTVEESLSVSVVEENKDKKMFEDYDTLEDIDFQDEEQVKKGRLNIYQKILSAEQEYEETKKKLALLKHKCHTLHEELETFNLKVKTQPISQELDLSFVTISSSDVAVSNSSSLCDLQPTCEEILPSIPSQPLQIELLPSIKVKKIKLEEKSSQMPYQKDKSSASVLQTPSQKDKKMKIIEPQQSLTSSISQTPSQKRTKIQIQRKSLDEVLNNGDRLYLKMDNKLYAEWVDGELITQDGENSFKSLSQLLRHHAMTVLGKNSCGNAWTSYDLVREGTLNTEPLDPLFVIS